MIVTIIVFLLLLGVLIFVHEAGHFATARRNGITCHEFGFGFPPRLGGVYKNTKTGKWTFVWGNKEYHGNKTLYSLNWIPLGGFVRIKGEDGMDKDPDSFATQKIWVRFKVLFAGVFMNFVLAWVLISVVLMIGAPEVTDNAGAISTKGRIISAPQVQINTVEKDSPAEQMGIKVGDVISEVCGEGGCQTIATTDDLITATTALRGQVVEVRGARGSEQIRYQGTLRTDENKGALGVSMAETAIVQYPWYSALWEGLLRTISLIVAVVVAFASLIVSLVTGGGIGADIAGPVGIAQMTGQMRDLGWAYLLQFSAILSINLGIINALPIPALDGGRILFLFIEKIKGRPVDQKIEGYIHSISFMVLILLMLLITARDILKFF